jgi:hypothetical protein
MPNFAGSLDTAKRNIVAIGVWYFAPYRLARKLFFSSAHFAEKVTDWELSRNFQRRHSSISGIFGFFIWLPFTALFSTLCVLPALFVIMLAVVWPWVFTLISYLLLDLVF